MTSTGPTVIRRRRGPFKRSRTGCGTCKRRGKKCDEMWSADGSCQRCIAGPWECSGTAAPQRAESSGGAAGGSVDSRAGSAVAHSGDSGSNPGGIASSPRREPPPVAMTMEVPSGLPVDLLSGTGGSSTTMGRSPLNSGLSRDESAQPRPLPALLNLGPTSDYSIPHLLGMWDGDLSSDAWVPLLTQPLAGNGGAGPPVPRTMAPMDSSFGIDGMPSFEIETSHPDTGLLDIWSQLGVRFPTDDESEDTGVARVLFFNADSPTRQGVPLAEIYARVVESWLVGLPGPTRDYARARILALHDSSHVMRVVRYAVAAAYIFLFASGQQGGSAKHHQSPGGAQPQPKLVELAARGSGRVNAAPITPGRDDEESVVRKIRVYVDQVSTPFAADLESTKWTEDAIQELKEMTVTTSEQLSDLLWGVIDLQLVEFIRGGAAPSYSMLALGDRLVRSAMGSDHPTIRLADLRSPETFSLRLYALSDVSRCIVQRGRRTMFTFDNDNGLAAGGPDDEMWSTYLGLPDAIVILLAAVVNLCADMPTLSRDDLKHKAEKLESDIHAWRPPPMNLGGEPSAVLSRTIAGELWRQCTLILLYQSVHRMGGLHPVLRGARAQILNLLGSITQLPNGDLYGFIALPAFLSACLSITNADRKRAMSFLLRTGPERVWLDNIAVVEKVWDEMDATGRLIEWHEKMGREGLTVAFF